MSNEWTPMSPPLSIAVIGSGISGLSAAWLLSKRHSVTLFEADRRPGGHSNTVDAVIPGTDRPVAVDTGFIVYNTQSYPNLVALFEHLEVPTARSNMSFAVSMEAGGYEYSGTGLGGIFGQRRNLVRPGHLRMLLEIRRFFREAPSLLDSSGADDQTLGGYLEARGYSDQFVRKHIVPMAAAIWSAPSASVLEFPAASFVRFFSNHGLLQVKNRPEWRTVVGGSRQYVSRLLGSLSGPLALHRVVTSVERDASGVTVVDAKGRRERFDHCVIATHADDALRIIDLPTAAERDVLGCFKYQPNLAVLHTDASYMPQRRAVWSSWNYMGDAALSDAAPAVTYWMNRLQPLGDAPNLFVTLNPGREIAASRTLATFTYTHPIFDERAMAAQKALWSLQGKNRLWFAGSYFGYGFHEDGLQAGLAVAEALGGVRRPWTVANECGRITIAADRSPAGDLMLEAAE